MATLGASESRCRDAGFDDDRTVREMVRLYRGMYPGAWTADEVIELV